MSRDSLAQPVWVDERILERHLAYDLSHGQPEKASAVRKLPLFEVAMGENVDEVAHRWGQEGRPA